MLGKILCGVFVAFIGPPLLWFCLNFFLLPLVGLPMFGDN